MRALLASLFLITAMAAQAATYYVDFNAGSDVAAGTSTGAPWKTLPGTRNAVNSAYVSTAYGGTTFTVNANLVPAGTIFVIKAGTSLTSANGGWIQIDSAWYSGGSAGSPITIMTATNWGSGAVIINGSGMTLPTYRGLINIDTLKYFTIDGQRPSGIILTNSPWNGIRVYDNGTNGLVLRNIESGGNVYSGVDIRAADGGSTPLYISSITLDTVNCHDNDGTVDDSTSSPFYFSWLNGFTITNCSASNGVSKVNDIARVDGFHFGSSHNGWILNCIAMNCTNQGFDLGRDGSYKTRDDASNITVRACSGIYNGDNNFDHNSGMHDVLWLQCASFGTQKADYGSAGFNVHQGTAGTNWWINCSSEYAWDRGFNFGWDSNPWNIPAGTYDQYLINCISSGDSTNASGSNAGSVWVDVDTSTNISRFHFANCIFNTTSQNYGTVNNKGTIYTAANVQNRTGGWPGTSCVTNDPSWKTTSTAWSTNSERLNAGSVGIGAGAWVFKTSASGSSSTTLTITNSFGLDARRVFLPGDTIQIEFGSSATITGVTAADTVTLSSPLSWSVAKGAWFPWTGTGLDIGAFPSVAPGVQGPGSINAGQATVTGRVLVGP